MLKTIFKTILIIVILLIAGLGAYWYFDRQQGGSGIPLVGNNSISIGDLFPFGNGGNTPVATTTPIGSTNPSNPDGPQTPVAPPRLWKISTNPQSGAVAFLGSAGSNKTSSTSATAATPFVRFVDKASGNIYESSLQLIGLNRISNTTIPKVYEALWQPNANSVVMRYLDQNNVTIKSTFSTLIPNKNTIENAQNGQNQSASQIQELRATFLPNDISNLAVNRNNGALAYVVTNQSGAQNGSQIFVTKTDGSSTRQIFESAIRDLSVSWVNDTMLGLLSKPSASAIGQFYFLKTDSGQLQRVMGDRNGLVALANPTGTKVFFSVNSSNGFSSGLFDTKTGLVTTVPFKSIPDKCVWSKKTAFIYCATPKTVPSGDYPDSWYEGKVSFNDALWRMDTATGATEFLIDPVVTTNEEIDAMNLTLDPTEQYLTFTNKKDSQLWGLRIEKIGS